MDVDVTEDGTHVLDTREIDGEPFSDIMAALDELPEGEGLRLINTFKPIPLFTVLEQRGYTHETTQVDDDLWYVHIERE